VKNFEAALGKNRSDLLLIAAAKAYVDASEPVKAEALLLEVLANGRDDLAKENGRFVLGEIYKARGDTAKSEEQYQLILSKNPASAEAHYRLGLVYQVIGDPIKARAEWRKAVSIDPMHAAARQKLSEKL
jgi:tetratricopeptide (TPR) repeat protein